jgi:hypothetical protein
MATLETLPPEVHFQIFSYLSTATLRPLPSMTKMLGITETVWNEIDIHPLHQLSATSKTLRTVVESYSEHRLQHLLTVRAPGKGPSTPFAPPYCSSYLRYMAQRCTFCYERAVSDDRLIAYGAVDLTIPVCDRCRGKFPCSRRIAWAGSYWEKGAKQKYELPLEELKANCTWSRVVSCGHPLDSEEPGDEAEGHTYRGTTYVFDEREIQRYVKKRYGDLDTFFAAIEKKRWDKKLEMARMEKQRRWAREEIERRIAASEPLVKQFIAQHEALETKRAQEMRRMCDELERRTDRREEMFRGWLDTFLNETAGPGGRCKQTCDAARLEKAARGADHELLSWERTFQHQIMTEERVTRDLMIKQFRLYMRNQVAAEVLLKYGLDSLVDPTEPKKRLRHHRHRFRPSPSPSRVERVADSVYSEHDDD